MSLEFLLEIGAEEIPAWMIPGALESLRGLFQDFLDAQRIGDGVGLRLDATPRRLVLRASGLPAGQRDAEELLMGPAKTAPPQAVAGFAKKQAIDPSVLAVEVTPKGEYFVYRKQVAGRSTKDLLSEALPGIIGKIPFPKTMYWTGKDGARFIRPIRWLVALLGDETVPFTVAGVPSGNTTCGHRRLGGTGLGVTHESYEAVLRENAVILSAAERRAKIESEARALEPLVRLDESLVEELAYLTEYPTAITGGFAEEFLRLPEEVLSTVMRHHQRYFAVSSESGGLAPSFVAILNLNGDPAGVIRRGNERVLRARFNDAVFFWETDQKRPLPERVADLANVTFQAKLGSYLEKAERMEQWLTESNAPAEAVRAARLAKCDLTTELVKEFTELQGVVGGLYARSQGEPEAVWQAIYDQYRPVSMEDAIPRAAAGQWLALADKLDTLRGCFRVGMIPSGSKDPFALRRAAQGVVRICAEGAVDLDLAALLAAQPDLIEFFLDRVRYYFREVRGFAYDEVNAVLAAGWSSLRDAGLRLDAVRAVRASADFEPLAASFKRIQNILKQAGVAGGAPVRTDLLEPGPEERLYQAFDAVRNAIRGVGHQEALARIATLRPAVDGFFDSVMVNAPDQEVRSNRLALLNAMLDEFSTIAVFSEIVTN